jgi:uncharacterized protein YciI
MQNAVRFVFLMVAALVVSSSAAAQPAAQSPPVVRSPDGTEMTQYFVVLLRRGPAWTSALTPETTKVSQGHQANIQRLTKEGKMVVAGPFDGQTGERALAGIFILRVASMDEAKAAVDTDPAVKAGRFVYEIAPWWGPTSLKY